MVTLPIAWGLSELQAGFQIVTSTASKKHQMIEMTNLYLGVLYESQTSNNMTIFRFLAEKELIFRSRLIIHISQSQVHPKRMKNDSYLLL